MTIDQFRIWFEGFSAGAGNPTPEQLAIVKQKLAEVDGEVKLPSKWTSTNTWENLNNKDKKGLLHD